jgi:hypothetical protein
VTLLINDRASSSIERWRARHYSSCASPLRQFSHLPSPFGLPLYDSTGSPFYTLAHIQNNLSLSLILSFREREKRVPISPTPSLMPLFFIINVNVLRKPYSAWASKMILVKYTLLPFSGFVSSRGLYFLAYIHSHWRATLVITPLQCEGPSSARTDTYERSHNQ